MRRNRVNLRSLFLCGIGIIFLIFVWNLFNNANSHKAKFEKELWELRTQLRHSELRVREQKALLAGLLRLASEDPSAIARRDGLANLSSTLRLPTGLEILNHLKDELDAYPRRAVLSSKALEPRRLVIGIPTIIRSSTNYIHDTLNSLLNTADKSAAEILVIVAIAPVVNVTFSSDELSSDLSSSSPINNTVVDDQYHKQQILAEDEMLVDLAAKYSKHVEAGRLEFVVIPRSFYPNLARTRWQLGDGLLRSAWRMKQALDAAYLMMYARFRGIYYLHLEDDVIAKPDFAARIDSFIISQPDNDWFILEFSRLGFIGKLFHTQDLDRFTQFVLIFFPYKPIDWLLEYMLDSMVCSPEHGADHCTSMKKLVKRTYDKSLFQHFGYYSSLEGKVQKLQDKNFGKVDLFIGHRNPSADVVTTVAIHKEHTAKSLYEGLNFFWGVTPKADDTITINFHQPVVLRRFYIHSGNTQHPSDKCLHAVVEVRFARAAASADAFEQVGVFDKYGEAISNASMATAPIGPLATFRIRFTKKHTSWVVISEILIA